MSLEPCSICHASTWCRWTGPAATMPCGADLSTGLRHQAAEEIAQVRAQQGQGTG